MIVRAFWIALICTAQILLSTLVYTPAALAYSDNQNLVAQVWRIVNQAYLDDTFNHQNWWAIRERFLQRNLPDRDSTYESIKEMLATLNDPFTRLMPPEQYRGLKVNTSGELSGVGLQIVINPETKTLEVIAPLAGSPAEKAGIQPRDRILAIDGVTTTGLTIDQAAARMRGKVGTKVSLEVESPGKPPTTLEIVRDRITLNPVFAKLDQSHGVAIGYIRLSQFSANAPQEMAHTIRNLENQGAKGFILDLRNNPGGLLQAGIEIARQWLDDAPIVYTVNRQGMLGNFSATNAALTNAPLVVLVNQGTASASEILAGALQDNGRAVIIGETTFGKGLIQSLFDLADGSGLAVTVAKYETPAHHDINKIGINPDQTVSLQPITFNEIGTEKDSQYLAAVKMLASQAG